MDFRVIYRTLRYSVTYNYTEKNGKFQMLITFLESLHIYLYICTMKRIEVNTGDRYGHLTIVKESEPDKYFRKFICLCDCGNVRDVYIQNLRSGLTQSCGCRRDKNVKTANTKHTDETLIGIKHGSWTILSTNDVLKQRVIKQIQNVIMKKVEVQCEHCGTKKKIFYNSFIYKNPATCNCQKPKKQIK